MLLNRRVCGLRLPDLSSHLPVHAAPFNDTSVGYARLPFFRGVYARGNPVTTLLSYRNPANTDTPAYPGGKHAPFYSNPAPSGIVQPNRNLKALDIISGDTAQGTYAAVQQKNNIKKANIFDLPFFGSAPTMAAPSTLYGGNGLPGYTQNYPNANASNPNVSNNNVSYSPSGLGATGQVYHASGNPFDSATSGTQSGGQKGNIGIGRK